MHTSSLVQGVKAYLIDCLACADHDPVDGAKAQPAASHEHTIYSL